MGLKRRGWIRIGLAATALWIGIGAFWGYRVGDLERTRTVVYWRSDCVAQSDLTYDQCSEESNKLWPEATRRTWETTGIYALAPVPLGWLVAYGMFALVCWIRTGFREAEDA